MAVAFELTAEEQIAEALAAPLADLGIVRNVLVDLIGQPRPGGAGFQIRRAFKALMRVQDVILASVDVGVREDAP